LEAARAAATTSVRAASTVPLSKFEPNESLNDRYAAMEKRLAVRYAAGLQSKGQFCGKRVFLVRH
jgi:hypothetical protein